MRRTLHTRRRRREPHGSEGQDIWLLTYGDLVTTLMAFFILLYSLSSVSAAKFRATAASLAAALGGSNAAAVQIAEGASTGAAVQGDATAPIDLDLLDPQMVAAEQSLQSVLKDQGLAKDTEIRTSGDKVIIRFGDTALFPSGDSTIQPSARPLLDAVAAKLKKLPNDILVEGHTDSDPIFTARFPSNYDLSGARASSVARYLQDFHGIAPERLSIAGYGPNRPVAPNDTPEGRAKNRRVDIVILPLQG